MQLWYGDHKAYLGLEGDDGMPITLIRTIKDSISKGVLPIVVTAVICVVPLATKEPYMIHILIMSLVWAVAAASWDLVWGYMGQFHFAQVTLLGIGAYSSAIMSMRLPMSPWLSIPLAGLIAGGVSIAISLPAIRLKPMYLAVVTFSFLQIVYYTAISWVDFTGGFVGLIGVPPLFSVTSVLSYYYLAVALFTLSISTMYVLVNSRYGLALKAIRGSEPSAGSLGVEISRFKILFIFVSAFFTGVMGAFVAHYLGSVGPYLLTSQGMIKIMVIAEVGGLGSLYGSVIGSFLLTFLLEYFRFVGVWRFIIYGAALILIMMIKPRGIYGGIVDVVEWIKRNWYILPYRKAN